MAAPSIIVRYTTTVREFSDLESAISDLVGSPIHAYSISIGDIEWLVRYPNDPYYDRVEAIFMRLSSEYAANPDASIYFIRRRNYSQVSELLQNNDITQDNPNYFDMRESLIYAEVKSISNFQR